MAYKLSFLNPILYLLSFFHQADQLGIQFLFGKTVLLNLIEGPVRGRITEYRRGNCNPIYWLSYNYHIVCAKKEVFNYADIIKNLLKKFRNIRLCISLGLMDTSLEQNTSLILKMKSEVLNSGLLEAYLESAPQFILQCSIILRTGNTSK